MSIASSAPSASTPAGLEALLISVAGCALSVPPALAFATYRVADTFVHPLRPRDG